MSHKLLWDKPYDSMEILCQLKKLGENSINPIALRKNESTIRTHKNKKAQAIITESIEIEKGRLESNDEKIYLSVTKRLHDTKISLTTVYNLISNIKTKKFKIKLLHKIGSYLLENNKSMDIVFHIYISLKLEHSFIPPEILNEVNTFINDFTTIMPNVIGIQMNKFSEFIYPKDFFNTDLPKLDDWQKVLLDNIDKKNNILLIAPTSAGKTNLAVHVVEVSNKSIFVVPTDVVARQVAGMLINLNYSVALVTARETIIQNNNFKVLVGTPNELEDYVLQNPKITFSYIICDEIHHIGNHESSSSSFERLLKSVDASLLAMSATVGNPDAVKLWLETIHKKSFIFINHKKRFINQQKHFYFNGEIVPLHPLSTINQEYLKKNGFTSSLTFTARDLYQLHKITNLECFSPYTFFTEDIIKNNDLLDFEENCKQSILQKIAANDAEFYQNFFVDDTRPVSYNTLDIIKILFSKKMYPSLLFTNSYEDCMKCYKKAIDSLEKEEEKKYPYYKENNQIRHEFYQEFYREKEKILNKTEIPKDCNNSQDYLNQVELGIQETFLDNLKLKFKSLTNNRLKKIEENTTLDLTEKNRLTEVCKNDLDIILNMESLIYIDPYRPHPEFTFTTSITSDKMRKLKNRLSKALEINIDYTHTFLRGLERGIIVYHSQLQTPFQNEIQALIVQKEVNFIIADESLGAGVNMPIKSVVLLSDDFSSWDYNKVQQMCGRSGRRGIDREGHIIYVGKNWKKIVANPSRDITGDDIVSSINILPEYIYENPNKKYILNSFKITLQEFIENKTIDNNRIAFYRDTKIKHKSLIWNIRSIKNCTSFDTIFEDFRKVTTISELCGVILKKIYETEDIYIRKILQDNHITSLTDPLVPFKLRMVGNILILLNDYISKHNYGRKYQLLIVQAFGTIKHLLFKLDKTF